ncbi:MAG TPA: SH3 domain-containing protein [Chloroflexota bacterium]|nr:SH3 domain-containing protein [Chloroflexota bacterium]
MPAKLLVGSGLWYSAVWARRAPPWGRTSWRRRRLKRGNGLLANRALWLSALVGLVLALGPRPLPPSSEAGLASGPPAAPPPNLLPFTAEPPPVAAQTPPGFRALAPGQTAYARRGGAYVRAAPSPDADLVSQLFYDTPLPLLGEIDQAGSPAWYQVELWGVLQGWISAAEVLVDQPPPSVPAPWERGADAGGGSAAPRLELAGPTGPAPLATTGHTIWSARWRAAPNERAPLLAELPAGTSGTVTAWATDDDTEAWFELQLDEGSGWVYGVNLSLDPPAGTANGEPAARLAGKGMWVSRPFLPMANPERLVQAAKALGLTHLYVDVASSRGGFYSRDALAALLPLAHASGLRIVGWIWPTLADPLADVALSVAVAQYATPDGQRLDGLAPDLEERMDVDQVRAYIQVLRTQLGPDYLLVGTVFPPSHQFARRNPQHKVMAGWVDVLAPMTYWSEARREFSGNEVARYVSRAVDQLRLDAGDPSYPVAPIGQMYDTFGRNGIGAYSPGAAEITAALQASKDAGALGTSFFQWGTATPEEWRALRDFPW